MILVWWGVVDVLPILRLEQAAGGGPVAPESIPYVLASRAIMLFIVTLLLVLIRMAWKRNGYRDRDGLPEVPYWLSHGGRA